MPANDSGRVRELLNRDETMEAIDPLIVDGLNVTEQTRLLEDQGYTIIPDFLTNTQVS